MVMSLDEIRIALEEIYKVKGSRSYTKGFRDTPLYTELVMLYGDRPITELFYLGLHPATVDTCHRGNRFLFKNILDGYRESCGKAGVCACRREDQAKKVTETQANKTQEEKQLMVERQTATMMKNYGVKNPSHVLEINAKRIATNIERYGHSVPAQSEENLQRTEERTGYKYSLQNPDIRTKGIETSIERYGGLMTHARDAAYAKYDGKNPFTDPAVKAKSAETLMSKTGVNHPKRIHLSQETMEATCSKGVMAEVLKTHTLKRAANHLKISTTSVSRIAKKFDLEVKFEQSYEETNISNFIESLGFSTIVNSRKIISPLQIDVYVPEKKIAIEYCGLYWHSEAKKGNDHTYHKRKYDRCKEDGIHLITMFEDEWLTNQEVVKSVLRNKLGVNTKKLNARDCKIELVSSKDANAFYTQHHLIGGNAGSSINIGLTHKGLLVALMGFKKEPHEGNYNLLRYVTDGSNIRGGGAKCLEYFKRTTEWNKIITFADLRWYEGEMYERLGFVMEALLPPSYWYVWPDFLGRDHKFLHRKHKYADRYDITKMTEHQIMLEEGYNRIYDCGKKRYVLVR